MKAFTNIVFDPAKCRRELTAFGKLLQSKEKLGERKELQGFFKARQQLTAFIGTFAPDIGPAKQLAYEYPLFGDFAADVVIGNRDHGEYCFIELEDGRPDGIFTAARSRSTKE
jgi:hypothetical protein